MLIEVKVYERRHHRRYEARIPGRRGLFGNGLYVGFSREGILEIINARVPGAEVVFVNVSPAPRRSVAEFGEDDLPFRDADHMRAFLDTIVTVKERT